MKQTVKRMAAALLAAAMCAVCAAGVLAAQDKQENAGSVYFTAEAGTIGFGYLVAPQKVALVQGESVGALIIRVMADAGYTCVGDSSYISAVQGDLSQKAVQVPAKLDEILRAEFADEYAPEAYDPATGALSGGDVNSWAGWMACVNNVFPTTGLNAVPAKAGDVIRFQFSLAGGSDIGGGWMIDENTSSNYYDVANKDALIKALADIGEGTLDAQSQAAYDVMAHTGAQLLASQGDVDYALEAYQAALNGEVLTTQAPVESTTQAAQEETTAQPDNTKSPATGDSATAMLVFAGTAAAAAVLMRRRTRYA